MNQIFAQAKKIIDASKNILLATHKEPDGDALGSMLALNCALKKFGKNISVFSPSAISSAWDFLPGIKEIKKELDSENPDLIVGLDYGNPNRLMLEKLDFSSREFLTIDHHLIGEPLGLKIVDLEISSTCEIIYDFLSSLNFPIDQEIAVCLLTGIFSDTGGFCYSNTSAKTLKIAGDLLAKGAPLQKIAKAENSYYHPNDLNLWATAFKNLEIDLKAGVIFALVTQENCPELENTWRGSTVASLLSNVPEIKFALMCTEREPGRLECSLRSQNNRGINVANIAQLFGGGGHRLAAGFQTTAKPEEVIARIKNLVL